MLLFIDGMQTSADVNCTWRQQLDNSVTCTRHQTAPFEDVTTEQRGIHSSFNGLCWYLYDLDLPVSRVHQLMGQNVSGY